MEKYTLKLVSGIYTYKLYSGTTLVSDTDLAALFATAGSAYFSFDFDGSISYAPHAVEITNSSNTRIVYDYELTATVLEGKNYKATWSNSATTFDTFEELEGKTLDESQLSFLMGKIKEAGPIVHKYITEDVYAWNFLGGTDAINKFIVVHNQTDSIKYLSFNVSSLSRSYNNGLYIPSNGTVTLYFIHTDSSPSTHYKFVGVKVWCNGDPTPENTNGEFLVKGAYGASVNRPQVNYLNLDVVDSLTSTYIKSPLSAAQGKALADRIGDLATLTTTDKTSTVNAINELMSLIPTSGEWTPIGTSDSMYRKVNGVVYLKISELALGSMPSDTSRTLFTLPADCIPGTLIVGLVEVSGGERDVETSVGTIRITGSGIVNLTSSASTISSIDVAEGLISFPTGEEES